MKHVACLSTWSHFNIIECIGLIGNPVPVYCYSEPVNKKGLLILEADDTKSGGCSNSLHRLSIIYRVKAHMDGR